MELSHVICAVKYNRNVYTQRKCEHSKEAIKLYHIVLNSTIYNYKHILGQNIINNYLVTIDDVNLAENVSGPNIGSIKGKITRSKPKPVKYYLV